MDQIKLGDFSTWEKNGEYDCIINYTRDDIKRLTNRQIPIINELIKNSLLHGNSISSKDIWTIIDTKYDKDKFQLENSSQDAVKAHLKRLKNEKYWKDIIKSDGNGYKIVFALSSPSDDSSIEKTVPNAASVVALPDKTRMRIKLADGAAEEFTQVIRFGLNEINKQFVVFTKNDADKDGNIIVFVKQTIEVNNQKKIKDVNPEDWERVKEATLSIFTNNNWNYKLQEPKQISTSVKIDSTNQPELCEDRKFNDKSISDNDGSLKSEFVVQINKTKERNETKFDNLKVGEDIYFGTHYEENILWRVLNIQDRKALVISEEILDIKAYHEPGGSITWHDCTLRKWLNNEFINKCFTQYERDRILPCSLDNDNNLPFIDSGLSTTDKVFLISISEFNSLFTSDVARNLGSPLSRSYWWLRSPGAYSSRAALVHVFGEVWNEGLDVACQCGVRPALWIDLDS